MSRPEDVPQDVWDDAIMAATADDTQQPLVIAARAIMFERERNARAVEAWKAEGPLAAQFALVREAIATSIREGRS